MTLLFVQRTVINIAAEAKLADKQMMGVRLNATCVEKVLSVQKVLLYEITTPGHIALLTRNTKNVCL